MAASILFSFPTLAPGAAAHLDFSIPMKSIFLKPLPISNHSYYLVSKDTLT